MFTGLVEDVGTVRKLERNGSAARLAVSTSIPVQQLSLGDSIAVNGACLTVVAKGEGEATFDVSPETLARTTLNGLASGSRVNLERALRFGDRLGGHIVTGHVDFVATIIERRELAGNIIFSFRIQPEFGRYLVEKGSVAIDGISLTVNSVSTVDFSVNIIPHTAAVTILKHRRPGDVVNIETDILGKYVERLLNAGNRINNGSVTLELLEKSGFM